MDKSQKQVICFYWALTKCQRLRLNTFHRFFPLWMTTSRSFFIIASQIWKLGLIQVKLLAYCDTAARKQIWNLILDTTNSKICALRYYLCNSVINCKHQVYKAKSKSHDSLISSYSVCDWPHSYETRKLHHFKWHYSH